MKTATYTLAVVLITSAFTTQFVSAQQTSKDQLANSIVNEFRVQSGGQKRVVVRDFRTAGSVDAEMTEAIKTKLQASGITPSLVADYEIEGRFKFKDSYGRRSYVLETRFVSPNGYDNTREYSVPSSWFQTGDQSGNFEHGGAGGQGGQGDRGHEHQHGQGEMESGESVGHQIYPNQEWKVYHLPADIMSHCQNGFILDQEEWNHFWSDSGSPSEVPYVNFAEQMVRIETVPYPRTINAELFSAGSGALNVTKNISNEPISDGGWLNAHVLIISKSDLAHKRKVRLGVTVDATHDGRGVIITSVVDGAPVTRGRLDDGRSVALEAGDVIYSLNGIQTDSIGMFADIIKNSSGTLRAEIRNVQNGERIYVTFELE